MTASAEVPRPDAVRVLAASERARVGLEGFSAVTRARLARAWVIWERSQDRRGARSDAWDARGLEHVMAGLAADGSREGAANALIAYRAVKRGLARLGVPLPTPDGFGSQTAALTRRSSERAGPPAHPVTLAELREVVRRVDDVGPAPRVAATRVAVLLGRELGTPVDALADAVGRAVVADGAAVFVVDVAGRTRTVTLEPDPDHAWLDPARLVLASRAGAHTYPVHMRQVLDAANARSAGQVDPGRPWAASDADVCEVLGRAGRATVLAVRDALLLVVGFGAGLTREQMSALVLGESLTLTPEGVVVDLSLLPHPPRREPSRLLLAPAPAGWRVLDPAARYEAAALLFPAGTTAAPAVGRVAPADQRAAAPMGPRVLGEMVREAGAAAGVELSATGLREGFLAHLVDQGHGPRAVTLLGGFAGALAAEEAMRRVRPGTPTIDGPAEMGPADAGAGTGVTATPPPTATTACPASPDIVAVALARDHERGHEAAEAASRARAAYEAFARHATGTSPGDADTVLRFLADSPYADYRPDTRRRALEGVRALWPDRGNPCDDARVVEAARACVSDGSVASVTAARQPADRNPARRWYLGHALAWLGRHGREAPFDVDDILALVSDTAARSVALAESCVTALGGWHRDNHPGPDPTTDWAVRDRLRTLHRHQPAGEGAAMLPGDVESDLAANPEPLDMDAWARLRLTLVRAVVAVASCDPRLTVADAARLPARAVTDASTPGCRAVRLEMSGRTVTVLCEARAACRCCRMLAWLRLRRAPGRLLWDHDDARAAARSATAAVRQAAAKANVPAPGRGQLAADPELRRAVDAALVPHAPAHRRGRALTLFGLATGGRPGAIAAVRTSTVRAVVDAHGRPAGLSVELPPTKNETGRPGDDDLRVGLAHRDPLGTGPRSLLLDQTCPDGQAAGCAACTVEDLVAHHRREGRPDGLLFAADVALSPLTETTVTEDVRRVARGLGHPGRFSGYSLRVTFGSRLAMRGWWTGDIAPWLRHTSLAATARYQRGVPLSVVMVDDCTAHNGVTYG